MNGNLIITIGRQSGSGGKVIGQKLAERMGVECYDKELLSLAAKQSGLCEELFEKHDERPTSSFLYSLVMDSYSMGYTASGYSDMPINHKIFLAQFDAIKKLASEKSCVIVGRCADYALAAWPASAWTRKAGRSARSVPAYRRRRRCPLCWRRTNGVTQPAQYNPPQYPNYNHIIIRRRSRTR